MHSFKFFSIYIYIVCNNAYMTIEWRIYFSWKIDNQRTIPRYMEQTDWHFELQSFYTQKISSKSHLKGTLKKLFIFEFKQLSKCCFLYFSKFLNFFGYFNRCNMLWPTYQTQWYIHYFSWQSFIYICKYASLYKLIE